MFFILFYPFEMMWNSIFANEAHGGSTHKNKEHENTGKI